MNMHRDYWHRVYGGLRAWKTQRTRRVIVYRRTAWYNQTPQQIEQRLKSVGYGKARDFHVNKNVNPDGTRTLYHIRRQRDELTVWENTSHPEYEHNLRKRRLYSEF